MNKERATRWARWFMTGTCVIGLCLYQAGRETVPSFASSADEVDISTLPDPSGQWADGQWEGTAEGYGGMITLSVTIREGYIVGVQILDAKGEDKPYLRDARKIIPKIIAGQHTDLDAISGSTTTTWGILDAVDLALEEASDG